MKPPNTCPHCGAAIKRRSTEYPGTVHYTCGSSASENWSPPLIYCTDEAVKTAARKTLARSILDWHGGQGSALYAAGSTMLTGKLPPADLLRDAAAELRNLRRDARHPDAVTVEAEAECNQLAQQLETLIP